ncbi:Ethanolamine ammonia-lyase light chain [Citrobacter freundii]|uniref:Ethanolamine ammonia-lyase light chain n=1 Tax=Citrobacter freundii TaxID=546 RepID=A0A7G2IIM3_CITFR|nr:Ethanolamine ammonia-lyase light chain [Citrobacter freundii]
MDQKQIEEIVRSVMASMGEPQVQAPSAEVKCSTTQCAAPTGESCAMDLGSAEAKAWIGVENPHRAEVLTELRRSTLRVYVPVVPVRVRVPRRCCASWLTTRVQKTQC